MESRPLMSSRPNPSYNSSSTNISNNLNSGDEGSEKDARFLCNICLESVQDPVITVCGHLYCWPCLYRWLDTRHTTCPVCSAGVNRDNVIPLFIKGSEMDPRNKQTQEEIPNRPNAQRPEASRTTGTAGTAGNGNAQFAGLSFTAGFGFFPSLFGLQFQSFVDPLPPSVAGRPRTPMEQEQESISKMLVALCIIVVFCLFMF